LINEKRKEKFEDLKLEIKAEQCRFFSTTFFFLLSFIECGNEEHRDFLFD
jgi:hypothetical protein